MASESGPEPVTTDRPAGPDPQGPSQAGAPAPPGARPTGHPPDSVAASWPESGLPDEPVVIDDAAGEGADQELLAVDEAVEEAEEAIAEDVSELGRLTLERDDYLDQLRRLHADFENYKKRVVRQQTEHIERATEELVAHLLPALDTFDLALAHGTEGLEPVYRSLLDILEGSGLERVDPLGQPFDPNEHDAVLHEEGDGGNIAPEVVEVLRAGYRWKGRVMRPAMVKVKG
ncbi:MAG TPA: nucleotide exchange factor GrpE [Acidimicrobiales bacterium]|nr:nucleotide exchange factor GrpE [Acidimicrobiales bacterium]